MSRRPADAPSLGVLVTGGVGVLVVVAFVAAIAFGRDSRVGPGDRVAVVRGEGPVGLGVLAARCPDERVKAVTIRDVDGSPLWRIVSDKGTIDRVFVVGSEPPPFFATETALRPLPPSGPLEVEVTIDDIVDRERFDLSSLEDGDLLGVPCGGSDLGVIPIVFILGGAGVVVAYGSLVRRFLRAR